jgi:hypothetical protein
MSDITGSAFAYRLATPEDLSALLGMARKFHEEFGYAATQIAFDEDSTALSFLKLIDDDDAGLVVVITRAESVVGMLAFQYFVPLFNAQNKSAVDAVFWIEPEHRSMRGGMAALLVAHVGLKADEVRHVFMKTLANGPDNAAKLYSSLGYAPTETAYVKEL